MPGAAGQLRGGDPVDSWYSEIERYVFCGNGRSPGTGHFTQVVWADTRCLGVGLASKDGKVMVVCNYDPPGNMIGAYQDNVLPASQ